MNFPRLARSLAWFALGLTVAGVAAAPTTELALGHVMAGAFQIAVLTALALIVGD